MYDTSTLRVEYSFSNASWSQGSLSDAVIGKHLRYTYMTLGILETTKALVEQNLLRILPEFRHPVILAPSPDLAVQIRHHDQPDDGGDPCTQSV
jgi:hypothetical protein